MGTWFGAGRHAGFSLSPVAVVLGILLLGSTAMAAPITLKWWAADWEVEQSKALIARFEKENPGIHVQVEYLPWDGMQQKHLIALRGGAAPDLINVAVAWNQPYAALGYLLPLDKYVTKEFKADFPAGSWATTVYGGHVYGIPYRSESHGLIYNKNHFREAGLDPERPPATWEELLSYSQKLTRPPARYGFGLVGSNPGNVSAQVVPFIWQNGGDILTPDNARSVLDQPKSVEAVQFHADLLRKHKVAPPDSVNKNNREVDQYFSAKVVSIIYSGNYAIPTIREQAPDIDIGTGLLPAGKAGYAVVLGGWNIVVSKTTKNPDAAWKFAEFLARPENMAAYTVTFPARQAAMSAPQFSAPELKPYLKMLTYVRATPGIPQWPQIEQIFYNQVQRVLLGQADAQAAMSAATREIDKLLGR